MPARGGLGRARVMMKEKLSDVIIVLIGVFGVVTIILTLLRYFGFNTMPWIFVFAPLWVPFAALTLYGIYRLVVASIETYRTIKQLRAYDNQVKAWEEEFMREYREDYMCDCDEQE